MNSRRILYVVNGFDPGGAEHGLLSLLQNDFFAGHELKILAFCRGRGALSARIAMAAGPSNVVLVSDQPTLTPRALLAGARALWREHRNWRPEVVVLSLKQANIVGRLVACFFPTSQCVSFEHIGAYRARRLEWMYRYVLWALSFRVDEICADSTNTPQTQGHSRSRRRKQHVLPVFYADEHTPYKTSYARHTPFRMVAAGRLVGRKNMILADPGGARAARPWGCRVSGHLRRRAGTGRDAAGGPRLGRRRRHAIWRATSRTGRITPSITTYS